MNILLIFALVFLPVGWFIYKMLRYTAKSLGDESPLSTVVTYEIYDWAYFTRFSFLFLVFLTLSSLLLLYITVFFAIPSITALWHALISLFLVSTSLFSLWNMAMLFALEWQYWLITRNKIITLNPIDKSLKIDTKEEKIRFTAADVQEIEQHSSGLSSSKMVAGYMYMIFRLKDGRSVYLNLNKNYIDFALDDYFKNVPSQRIPHKIPWIVAP